MSTNLGSAFVEVLADASPFADDFASAIGEAGELAEDELGSAMEDAAGAVTEEMEAAGAEAGEALTDGLDDAGGLAVDLMGEAGDEAGGALVSSFDDATGEVADVAEGVAADATAALGDVEVPPVDAGGAFADVADGAMAASVDATGALSDIDVPMVDAAGAFDSIPEAAEAAAGEAAEAFAGVGDEIADELEAAADDGGSALGGLTDKVGSFQGALATAGGGAGLEGFARSQQEASGNLRLTASALGTTEENLRGMAFEMSNSYRPASQVAGAMALLRQRGVENVDQMQELIPAFDNFADATGQTLPEAVDNATRGLGAMGVATVDTAGSMDAAVFLTNELGGDMQLLGRRMTRVSPEIQELDLSLEDMTGLLVPLTERTGSFRDATALLQDGLRDADGDMGALLESLGISDEEFAKATGKLDEFVEAGGAEGAAGMMNDLQTPLESAIVRVKDFAFKFGDLAKAAGTVAAPIGAIGPLLLGVNQATQLTSAIMGTQLLTGLKTAAAGFKTLSIAILTNPLFLIAAVIIGIIAVLWIFRDEIMAALGAAFGWLGEKLGEVIGWFRELPGKILAVLAGLAGFVFDFITKWHPAAILLRLAIEHWDEIAGWFLGLISGVVGWLTDLHMKAVGLVTGLLRAVIGLFVQLVSNVLAAGARLRDGFVDAVTRLVSAAVSTLASLISWVANLPGRIVRALGNFGRLLVDKGKDLIRGLWNGIKSMGSWLWDKVANFAANMLPGPVASALGLSSPSRLFAGYGEDIVRGLAQGVDREADTALREIEEFANRASVAGEPIGPSPVARGGERPVQVTVNQQPGESGEESVTRGLRRAGYLAGAGGR